MPNMDLSFIVAYFGEETGTINRRRMTAGGGFDTDGKGAAPVWTTTAHDGVVVVPSTGVRPDRLPEGVTTSNSRRVFWPATDGLRPASVDGQTVEDQIQYLGDWWKVSDIETYDGLGEFQDAIVVRVGRG